MFDFSPIWDNVSTQSIILLGIVGVVLIIVGVTTQGFGRALAGVLGIFALIVCILLLGSATEIGNWLKDLIFNPSTGTGGIIQPFKGEILSGIQLHTRI